MVPIGEKMNEHKIQNALYSWLEDKRHTLITPNVGLFGRYESDLVSVTAAGFVNEFEIKISRADYMAEFRRKKRKHAYLAAGNVFKRFTPNYYHFVFPEREFTGWKNQETPNYAGVILIGKNGEVKQMIQAKRLHNLKATEKELSYLSRGLMFRYWGSRIKKGQVYA